MCMRYKSLYITAIGLSFGYFLTQSMQTPSITPEPSRQSSPAAEENHTPLDEASLFIQGLNTVSKSIQLQAALFKEACNQFIQTTNTWLEEPNRWVPPLQSFDMFLPYVQKLVVNPHEVFFIFGDIHGDLKTFSKALKKLTSEGILTNSWKLKQNHHLIFLGDYTDRGFYGTEIWYILFKLRKANPDPESIVILRGNHEDYQINLSFSETCGSSGYLAELRTKFNLPNYSYDKVPEKSVDLLNNILNTYAFLTDVSYNILPVALYLECGDNRILCTHGGLEPGFDPQPLYKKENPQQIFAAITELKRATEIQELFPSIQLESFKETIQDFEPTDPSDLCFLWNDFKETEPTLVGKRTKTSLEMSPALTQALLNRDKLQCVLRGHQHNLAYKTSPDKYGLYSLPDNTVHTIVSYSKIPGYPRLCEHYSFVKLETAEHFNDWKAIHLRDGEELPFNLIRTSPENKDPFSLTTVQSQKAQESSELSIFIKEPEPTAPDQSITDETDPIIKKARTK